jgi:hypothetical protein
MLKRLIDAHEATRLIDEEAVEAGRWRGILQSPPGGDALAEASARLGELRAPAAILSLDTLVRPRNGTNSVRQRGGELLLAALLTQLERVGQREFELQVNAGTALSARDQLLIQLPLIAEPSKEPALRRLRESIRNPR